MIGLVISLVQPQIPRDSTPGGAVDVWEWEDGIGMQWEPGIHIPTE